MAQKGTAQGTPSLDTNAGLTPKVAIVNPDGTPTMFFFRWLLTSGGKIISTAQTADDLASLEPFDPGADFAIAAGALDDARSAGEIAGAFADTQPAPAGDAPAAETEALFADRAPATEAAAEEAMLAAWLADRAPVAAAAAETRDVLANLPMGLNAGDTGRTFYATDYQHRWRWSGTAWTFGDTELGSGFVMVSRYTALGQMAVMRRLGGCFRIAGRWNRCSGEFSGPCGGHDAGFARRVRARRGGSIGRYRSGIFFRHDRRAGGRGAGGRQCRGRYRIAGGRPDRPGQ